MISSKTSRQNYKSAISEKRPKLTKGMLKFLLATFRMRKSLKIFLLQMH
jgi:hypothetical protein